MKGIIKLKVPDVIVKPKLFVITLSKDGQQKKFSKVDISLEKAISNCYWKENGSQNFYPYTLNNYINHVELSIDEINNLFKRFNP